MTSSSLGRGVSALVVAAWAANLSWSAESARPKVESGKASASSASTSTQRAGASRSSSAKGPLPDPALLDGSTQPAEKKSEHGMIGDFELPGDENVRNGKVGGPSGQQGGAQGQQQPQVSVGLPIPTLPSAGGAPSQAAPGGLNIPDPLKQAQSAGQQSAAGASGGAGPEGGSSQPAGAAGGSEGKAEGTQVGQLAGEGGAGQDAGGASAKPANVAIGDSAMRIEPSLNPAASGGQQQQAAGHTQQHDKGTGSGGKGTGGAQGGNRIEKGRVIPAGL